MLTSCWNNHGEFLVVSRTVYSVPIAPSFLTLLNMKIKPIHFSLTCIICLWVISLSVFPGSCSSEAQSPNQTPNLSQNSSLDARIARIENGLSPEANRDKLSNATFNVADRMRFYKVPGVSVAVINGGIVEWARGYGVREVGGNALVTPKTLFQAASISKPVTAMASLRLVQEGTLSLDENVNNKLVSWKVPDNRFTRAQKVTLRNILSHSASLTVDGFDGYISGQPTPTLLQILNGTKPANSGAVEVNGNLNQKFQYSGGGYLIVQQMLSDVTGKPFSEFIQETILGKLGMTSSTYQQPLPDSQRVLAASGHDDKGKMIRGSWRTYPEMAAAGLWTTPSDLAQFAIEIQQAADGRQSKVLNQKIVAEMLTPQVGGWGLGFELPGKGNSSRFAHSGGNEGYKCLMVAYKNTGQGAVIMTNSDKGFPLAIELLESIKKEYQWRD
jgi:CubicO group peptidase (beta-lactamase class C family)